MATLGGGRITPGTGTITYKADTATAAKSAGMGGTAQDPVPVASVVAQNLGADSDAGVFARGTPLGPDVILNFKALRSGVGIGLTEDSETITIASDLTPVNVGVSGVEVFSGQVGEEWRFSRIEAINGLDIRKANNTVYIDGAALDLRAGRGLVRSGDTLSLAASGVAANIYSLPVLDVDGHGRITSARSLPVNNLGHGVPLYTGSIGTGLTFRSLAAGPGALIVSGAEEVSIGLADTGVAADTYAFATLSVDAQGRVTRARSGQAVTAVTAGSGLTGGTITSSGTIGLAGMPANTVKGRGATPGAPADLTASELVGVIATAGGAGSGLDADLLDGYDSGAFGRLAVPNIWTQTQVCTIGGQGAGQGGDLPAAAPLITKGAAGTLRHSVQDGLGRVSWYWNTAGGARPTFEQGGEGAFRLHMHDDGGLHYQYAPGADTEAGEAIAWLDLLSVTPTTIAYKGTPLLAGNAAATAAKLQTPRAITLTGTVTGSAVFDGSADATILTGLSLAAGDVTGALGYSPARTDAPQIYAGQQNAALATLTAADGVVAWDLDRSNSFLLTLSADTAIADPLNPVAGGTYSLLVKQGGAGGFTLGWGAAFRWPGGLAVQPSAGADTASVYSFFCDGTALYATAVTDYA